MGSKRASLKRGINSIGTSGFCVGNCANAIPVRVLRKFSDVASLERGDVLAPRRQERQVRKFNFFAAPSTLLRTCFAPLREIFRVLVAALPRCVCGEYSFTVNPEEPLNQSPRSTGGRHLLSPFGLLVHGCRDLELAIESMLGRVDGHPPTQFAVKV